MGITCGSILYNTPVPEETGWRFIKPEKSLYFLGGIGGSVSIPVTGLVPVESRAVICRESVFLKKTLPEASVSSKNISSAGSLRQEFRDNTNTNAESAANFFI